MFKERIYLVGAELCWYFSNLSVFSVCARALSGTTILLQTIFSGHCSLGQKQRGCHKHTLICVRSLPVRVHV